MKHILTNPHNGAPIDHEGFKLLPGHQVHVRADLAQGIADRFGFLLHHVVPGDDKGVATAKPVKIKGSVNFTHKNAGEADMVTGAHVPVADHVEHVVVAPKKKAAAKKKK